MICKLNYEETFRVFPVLYWISLISKIRLIYLYRISQAWLKVTESFHVCLIHSWLSGVKARSHSTIFVFATAMQKMDCVDVNEGVHMVGFHVLATGVCDVTCD